MSKSALANGAAKPAQLVYSVYDTLVTLNATRASRLIRTGLSATNVDELVPLLGLSRKEDLGHALNANSTSLWRWARDNKPLPGQAVEQILRAMQLQLFAADVFGGSRRSGHGCTSPIRCSTTWPPAALPTTSSLRKRCAACSLA